MDSSMVGAKLASNARSDVLDVLTQEQQVLEELTNLATHIQEALICCDASALEALAGRQEALAQRLVELDGSRQELMEQWFMQDDKDGVVTEEVRDEDEETRLLAACEDVREQALALQTVNAANDQLLAGMARWMDGLLDGFADLFTQDTAYDRHGACSTPSTANLLMDRQI